MKLFLAFCQPYKVIGGPILTANTVGTKKTTAQTAVI